MLESEYSIWKKYFSLTSFTCTTVCVYNTRDNSQRHKSCYTENGRSNFLPNLETVAIQEKLNMEWRILGA